MKYIPFPRASSLILFINESGELQAKKYRRHGQGKGSKLNREHSYLELVV